MLVKTRGFSLVEVLIAIVIALILLALALPNFAIMLRNAKIRNLADSIGNGLNIAKVEAVRRNQPVSFTWLSDGSGWVVSDIANVPIQSQSGGNADELQVAPGQGGAVVTDADVVVTFNSLGRLVAGSGITSFDVASTVGGGCATQANPNGVRCLRLVVSTGGQVRMCDPALAAPNTQAC